MELMDLSAELMYRYVHHALHEVIPENVMAQIALAVSTYNPTCPLLCLGNKGNKKGLYS